MQTLILDIIMILIFSTYLQEMVDCLIAKVSKIVDI